MSTHQINVFVSHSWAYSTEYSTLESWIFNERWSVGQASLDFRNYSVPKNDPIHNANSDAALLTAIKRQMQLCHVIVIPLGMYTHYSKWIGKEIEAAAAWGKPILGVIPRGQQRIPDVVSSRARETVGWNKESVIGGIWRAFRG
ncbi:MAG: TIR domain-containing protein [Pseudomonadales bacterium]